MYKHPLKRIWFISALGVIAIALYSTLGLAGFKLSQFIHYHNLWQVIAVNDRLDPYATNPAVKKQLHWYTDTARNRAYIHELSVNARPYLFYVYQQVEKHNTPAEMALLPMIESNYRPYKFSLTGATGLWQMMPGTASGLGVKINWWYDGRRDIRDSTAAALTHLNNLHNKFHNWLLALAAYNCGAGKVSSAIHYNKAHHQPTDFWHLNLPPQTKVYVPRLLALAEIFRHPHKYHVDVTPVANTTYFVAINMQKPLALHQVAKLADASNAVVRDLNPGFRRWLSNPHEKYRLLLPIANADIFQVNLAQMSVPKNWIHYHVAKGQSLSVLAMRFNTTIKAIKHINHLGSNQIRTKQKLLLPNSIHGKYIDFVKHHHGSISEDRLPGPKAVYHTVRHHETLIKIAAKYNVTPEQIRYWNELGYHHVIHPRQKLIIWQ